MLKIIDGDIFASGADIIAHQTNCQGVMGSGVAKQVSSLPKTWEIQRQKGATLEELESGRGVDYSNLTLDDLEFDI